jgi:tetratricopeptide (TPR) repeat protein
VAIDETSFRDQPARVRARRAAVLAGIGLVWAAFLAAIGLFLVAGLILLAAAVVAVWMLLPRLPRVRVRMPRIQVRLPREKWRAVVARSRPAVSAWAAGAAAASRVAAARVRSAGRSGARSASVFSQEAGSRLRVAGASAAESSRRLAVSSRSAAARASTTAAAWRPPRRRDPRIDEALVSNSEGIALAKEGKHAEAIDAFYHALELLADTGDRHHEGQVLANLGTVHRQVGGDEAARFCWARALERLEPGTPESERTAELLGVR